MEFLPIAIPLFGSDVTQVQMLEREPQVVQEPIEVAVPIEVVVSNELAASIEVVVQSLSERLQQAVS